MEKKKLKIPKGKKLTWGIAGCGKFTEMAFLPTFQLLKKSRLHSVYSSSGERAKMISNKFSIPNFSNDFDEFLKNDFNVVYIGGSNSSHYSSVIKAAEAGKHILCEKPLAISSKEAEEMVKICEENGVILSVNYVHRFHPLIRKAKELLDNHILGTVVSLSVSFNTEIPPSDNFRFKRSESGGGVLRDIGTDMIDLLRYFGGEITEIKGFMDNIIYKSDVEDFASGIVRFERSGYGYFNVSFNTKKYFNRIEILGYNGAISIDNVIGKRSSQTQSRLTIDLQGESKKAFRKKANKLLFRLRDFQSAVLLKKTPMVTGCDGVINMKLIEDMESECRAAAIHPMPKE